MDDIVSLIAKTDASIQSWKWTPNHPFPELQRDTFGALQIICEYYLDADGGQREIIRQSLAKYAALRDQLFSFLYHSAQMIEASGEPKWLRLGLAAASLENLTEDARETYGRLGHLFLTAVRAGINPVPYFKQVGELSSSEVRNISNESMSDLLVDFDQSPYFKEEIEPQL